MEVFQVVDQAKVALTLVQKWPCKNEVIDLRNTKISRNHRVKSISFQFYSNKKSTHKIRQPKNLQKKLHLEYYISPINKKLLTSC